MSNEADTCRKYVLPRLSATGWTDEQIGGAHATHDHPSRAQLDHAAQRGGGAAGIGADVAVDVSLAVGVEVDVEDSAGTGK